jgi:hypothetical protein
MAALGASAAPVAQFLWKNKSKILNGIAGLSPKLKGPRKVIKDVLGFRERQFRARPGGGPGNGRRKRQNKRAGGVQIGGNGGYVHTVNAPVAFARSDTARPGFMLKTVDADTIIVHSVDSVQDITSSVAYNLTQYAVRPTDTTLFTFLANLLDMYTKYKLLSLKMHYVHFCPTSQAGSVMLTWCPDGNTTVPTTVAQQQNTNGCVVGASYEDFAYEANPKQFSSDWKFISDVTDADEDDRLIDEGIMFVATSNGTATGVGRFLVETEWALTGRRDPALAPMMGAIRQIISSVGSDEAKSLAAGAVARSAVAMLLSKKKQHRARPRVSDVLAQVTQDVADFGVTDVKDLPLASASIPPAVKNRLNVRP